MKFYKVDFSHDVKILGTSGPQIQGIDPRCKYHLDAPFSYRKIKVNEPLKEHITIPDMLLAKKTKWTDLMNSSMLDRSFRIVTSEFCDFLLDYTIDNYQVMDIKLTKSEDVRIYKALNFIKRYDHAFVSWENSSFGLVDKGFAPIKDILEKYTFKNLEEYRKKRSQIFHENKFKLKNFIVKFNRDIDLDFFRCLYPISGHFCSERLKDKILERGFTGFRFEELHDLEKPFWSIDYLGENNKSNT